MAEAPEDPVARWVGTFDALAGSYDQSGVPFFRPIAEGLVDRLDPVAGERALDVGVGRGAVTFALAEAVGPEGRVDAIDLAPGMVELARAEAADRGLRQVDVRLGDATDPGRDPALAPGSYDVLASSLVLFFLPDAEQSLRRWRELLRPGGRLGTSTFRPFPAVWRSIEDLFEEYGSPGAAPAPSMADVYADDEAVESMFTAAGLTDVRTEEATYPVPFDDVEQWRLWSQGTAMRGLWLRAPEEAHDEITRRVGEILDRAPGGLEVSIRYTLARR